ncbi:MAG TPA: pentapeptide repeat-containing protein [Magnetospirillum sp.]|nr:pentapeptide repeat-containing protein [Magnetospirillum sp.]
MRHPTQLHNGDVDWPQIRILVYSQDDAFRFLARQTFRKLAVREVLSTSVPADAAPMLQQGPDLALVDVDTDLAMAMAFLQRVRQADREMPVLLVAKAEDRPRLGPALTLGVEGMVPKPVSGHELVHRVGSSLKEPRRLPAPAPKVVPKPPAPVQAGRGGGFVAGGRGVGGGGSYGDAPTPASGAAKGGAGWLADDDLPAEKKKVAGGKLAWDDDAPAAAAVAVKGGAGSYGDEPPPAKAASAGSYGDDEAPAKGQAPAAKGRLDSLIDALPDVLKPKRRRKEQVEQDEAERVRWQAELAEAGHESRSGKDVAGLDVDAIVAAHLQWLTTQGAEGKRADFKKMDLAGGSLAGSVLANAGFREADLSDAQLADARLDGADFRYASLSAADLTGANLGVAQLRHSDLRLANLQGAVLRGADLSGARLRGAKLAGADFKGAILVGCDLSDSDLSKVDNLTQAQVEKAVFDSKTKLPPGVRRPRKDEE